MMYVCDFETTVDNDTRLQKETEVWAWACTQIFGPEDVAIGNTIEGFFDHMINLPMKNNIFYFTNLKFDASFIIDYIVRELGYTAAFNEDDKKYAKQNEMREGTFSCVITDLGIWYDVIINHKGHILTFRDTLKLLNYSVRDLGPAFNTKHRKLEIDYKGNMHKGGTITKEQQDYISNDVLVVKEALEAFFKEIGVKKQPPLTISQWALSEYKKQFRKDEWELYFPNLAEITLDPTIYGSRTVDEYVRKSYLGGWCYADERITGRINGHTDIYDVNSLYPSMMRERRNGMPIGNPTMIRSSGELRKFPKDAFYFIRFRCRFDIRNGYLPFIQLKHDFNYRSNENLRSSRYGRDGNLIDSGKYCPELTLSRPLFELFSQCYRISDFKFLDAAVFNTEHGLFDQYIDRWMKVKEEATIEGNKVKRATSKLAQNSIYGKFGKNPENSFKIPEYNEDSELVNYRFESGPDGKPVYIPIASAITSYARCFTVRAAIRNYKVFAYSDTDSIHLVCPEGYIPEGIEIHDTHLSCWKHEGSQDHSLFLRQKTYIEWSGSDYDIKACGMPDRSKILFTENLRGQIPEDNKIVHDGKSFKLSVDELEFMEQERTVKDFKIGFSVPGKLLPKIIKGGTVLQEVDFTIN